MKRKMISAAEVDAFTGWRRVTKWRPGTRKALKAKVNRRERREERERLKKDADE